MFMRRYAVRVKHDHGFINLTVHAQGREAAILTVMNAEGCPRRAIVSAVPGGY